MSLCDHIPSILDMFKVNLEMLIRCEMRCEMRWDEILEIEHENICGVM